MMKFAKLPTSFSALFLGAALLVAASPAFAQTAKSVPAANDKSAKLIQISARKGSDEASSPKTIPFMFGLFDAQKPEPAELSEEHLQNDEKVATIDKRKIAKLPERFQPHEVQFSGYKPGTIVIDTKEKFLYFVQSPVTAIRYGVAVGKEGLLFTGKAKVGSKQVWPRWIPTKEMIKRDPGHYGRYADGMDGGPNNPLGARAIYLYQGKQDTYLRIHGTNQPQTIGSASSNGCFRMINEHVMDLYDRVKLGAEVVVL